IEREPVLLTGAARFRLAHRTVMAAPGPFESISRLRPTSIPERLLGLDAQLQSNLVDPAAVRDFTRFAEAGFAGVPFYRGRPLKDVAAACANLAERLDLLRLVEQYQQLKSAAGLAEYADQLRTAVRLATEVPAVGETIRSRLRVVLLDEYQDTSAAQAQLLRRLFGDGRGFAVTAVGDPNQAIYGWRGAASRNILDFPEHFPAADGAPATQATLSVNRRSGTRILEIGNLLAPDQGSDGVELIAPAQTPPGDVDAHVFETVDQENQWLAEAILARHDDGVAWNDIAVLVRRNQTASDVYIVLRDNGIPTEIIGLGGLLHLPEVAPVVAMLRLLGDVGANAEVASLLASARWRLGIADLEALGQRARDIAATGSARRSAGSSLEDIVRESDPGEIPALLDAVEDPGPAQLSTQAQHRLAEFSHDLAELRRYAGEPVGDLVRRVISCLGLDVELLARAGRDVSQLERFTAAVSDYIDVDGDGSLTGLLAYLDAEDDYGVGLEQAVPSDDASVKLLTIHRAKGLEWDSVFLPSLADRIFPADDRTGVWPSRAELLPSPLRGDAAAIPQLRGYDRKAIEDFRRDSRQAHRRSEDRLAYVAVTRAKRLLVASTHTWTPGLKRPRVPSPYFEMIATASGMAQPPQSATANPIPPRQVAAEWPNPVDPDELASHAQAIDLVAQARHHSDAGDLEEWIWSPGVSSSEDLHQIQRWDREFALLREAQERRATREVTVPQGLSPTALMAMRADPEAFAANLVRPMPRRPSPAADVGSRFHEWVQRRFTQPLTLEEATGERLDPALQGLVTAFGRGRFAERQPEAMEVPFILPWRGYTLRGRIDAVYRWDGDQFDALIVDWKTSSMPADPLQLAVYRQAWAGAQGIDPARVGTAFYYVATDALRFVTAAPGMIDAALP
ncbi:MAG: 3'-5' exonuclease, partial [Arachnia sp.]